MSNKGKYYLTTAIAYTSGKPHIGNVYEIVLADAIARFKRMEGYDVFFQTGTDEHGQKNELKAEAEGLTPKEFVDKVAAIIKGQFDLMNVSYGKSKRSSSTCMTKEISTRALTKACTAPPARAFGPRASSSTASAPTADGKSVPPKRKPTSSR